MSVTRSTWGTDPAGHDVDGFTLRNESGMTVTLLAWGALVQSIRVPDRHGVAADVVLGFDSLAPYLVRHPNFGVTVGRFANRIAKAQFTLDGKRHELAANNGPNALHGGLVGFAKKRWQAELAGGSAVRFGCVSPDGEEGYPGTMHAAVTYALDDNNGLTIIFEATTDRPTIVNLTNHSYFNLAGSGDILGHELAVYAAAFLPVDALGIPTGEVRDVTETPMDCRVAARIGAHLDPRDVQQRNVNGGIDHTYVLGPSGPMKRVASVFEPASGRALDVHATQPGVQCYTGNHLDGTYAGKNGSVYAKHAGLCLETHHYPDSPNQPGFPSTVLRPGERYAHTAVYRFSTR